MSCGGVDVVLRTGGPGSPVGRHVAVHEDTVGDVALHCADPSAVAERVAAAGLDVLVGSRATELWGEGDSPGGRRVLRTVEAASRQLRRTLRHGDLVLLKASGPADHLERILLDRIAPITCWTPDCGRANGCDGRDLLRARTPATRARGCG